MLLSIILMGFASQVAWAIENQYFNVFLYNVVIPDPTYISYMVALSAVVATVTSILVALTATRARRAGGRGGRTCSSGTRYGALSPRSSPQPPY